MRFTARLLLVFALASAVAAPATAGEIVHRCTVELTESGGTVTQVPGWGADPGSALGQARRWSRILASERFSERVWAWAFWGDPQDAETARGLMALGAEDDPLRTPGAHVENGKCKKVRLPGKGFERWEATWSDGMPEPVVRDDPSTAIEAARRRACLRAAEDGQETTFMAVGPAAEEDKAPIWRGGMADVVEDLFACVAGGEPDIRGLAGDAAATETHGAYQCVAAVQPDTGGTTAGVGWSTHLERAGEEALTELVYSRRRGAFAFGLSSSARASAETRQTLLAAAYTSYMRSVAASDLADRARLGCVGIPEGADLTLGWAPGSLDIAQGCGDRPLWPPAPGPSSASGLAEARDTLCLDRAYYAVAIANDAVARASAETAPTMARAGWGVALTCEADCAANTALLVEAAPVAVAGVPDRSSRAAAEALLLQAVVHHDLELLLLVMPAFEEMILRRGIVDRYPLGFWLQLPVMIQIGLREGELEWVPVGGQWTVMAVD